METQVNIHARSQSSAPSDPSNFVDLDSQVQQGAFSALAAAAYIYAIVYSLAFMSDWVIALVADRRFYFPPLFDSLVAIVAVGYSLVVAHRCRLKSCPSCSFSPMAGLFLVVTSIGISAQAWGWEQHGSHTMLIGVSWVGVWIVLYAAIVTLPPKQILISSLLAWATVPATAALSLLVHGEQPGMGDSPWIAVARFAVPVLLCVGIAYAVAYRVFCLARDVSKARRLGSYQLSEKIGSGGMGEVWKATHRMLARPAAIKLIRPEATGGTGDGSGGRTMLRRFEREAQATAMLTSPHSIMLYDFGTTEDGTFYYVMELLEGRDLKSLIRESGPLPPERVVHFLRAACDSLADAHYRGLVHRDIKPGNLFTCRRGHEFDFIKVLDFGLVKSVREKGEMITQLTGTGTTSGTPGFMAPEVVTGDATVDGRADIYALGCVGYWLLTGQLVFDGNSPLSILIQHVKEEPPRVSTRTEIIVPPQLEHVIHACLAKDPNDRPSSASALGDMLAEVAATLPTWTRERAERWWQVHLPNLHAAPLGAQLDTAAPTVIAV